MGQLALNSLWSYLFFGLNQPGLAFLDIIVLWLALLATLIAFWQFYPRAGHLLLPYLLWVTFAAYLNLQIWRLNAWGTGLGGGFGGFFGNFFSHSIRY